jgi:orotidine-5'-phosphate decarboxylase
MTSFRARIKKLSEEKGRIILANDYNSSKNIDSKTIKNIKVLHNYLCGLKLNFHVLLPLGTKEIKKINDIAHDHGLVTIADIKLNDIGNTNQVTSKFLWNCGFDAIIVNPIMGKASLKNLVDSAHKKGRGIITLCHMSAPEARHTYELEITGKTKLYQLFLKLALLQKVDGIIVGATFPKIIQYCKNKAKEKLDIYSPGIGTQGGEAQKVISSGSDFLIVGRTILSSKNPIDATRNLSQLSFFK